MSISLENNLRPIKYLAISASLLTIGACSYKGEEEKYADLYEDAPMDASYYQYNDEEAATTKEENLNKATAEVADAVNNLTPAVEVEDVEQNARIVQLRSKKRQNPEAVEGDQVVAYRQSRFPEVASRPIVKGEYFLNSYLFVRNEQSWEQISKLIYGREDRATILAEWNSAQALKPGAVIYYSSPIRADDSKNLKSFEEDFGFSLESLVVREGDSLSLIAARTYGSPDSWREIASLNQSSLQSPDLIEIGQTLQFASSDRNTQPILDQTIAKLRSEAETAVMATNSSDVEATPLEESPVVEEEVASYEEAQAPPAEVEAPVDQTVQDTAMAEEPALTEATPAESSLNFEEMPMDDIAYLLVALLAVAGLIMMILRRRKAAMSKPVNYVSVVNDRDGTNG